VYLRSPPIVLQRSIAVGHRGLQKRYKKQDQFPIDIPLIQTSRSHPQVQAPLPFAGLAQQRCCFREDLLLPVRKIAHNPASGIHHSCQALSLHISPDKKVSFIIRATNVQVALAQSAPLFHDGLAEGQEVAPKTVDDRSKSHCSERTATTPLPSMGGSSYC